MPTLYIAEFSGVKQQGPNIGVPVHDWPPNNEATITIGATSTVGSLTLGASTDYVLLHADSDCHIAFGAAPTATTSNFKLTAGSYLSAAVNSGSKIATIQG